MKKAIKFIPLVFIAAAIILADVFLVPHSLKTELIGEYEYDSSSSYSYGEKYFFIKDDEYNGFYDGGNLLGYYLPEEDLSAIDTDRYTYLVSIERIIKSVEYSGLNCKRRGFFVLPDEYEAMIESDETSDGLIRIYRMKKINIDYDYHSE